MKKVIRDIIVGLILVIAGGVLGAYLNPYVQKHVFADRNELTFTLFEPIPNPIKDGSFQMGILENKGDGLAEEIIVKIKYPKTVKPLDYRIKGLEKISDITRDNEGLRFSIKKLPKRDFVLIALAINLGEITAKDVAVSSKQGGRLSEQAIKYMKLNRWEDADEKNRKD
jgi:hypothetical protein